MTPEWLKDNGVTHLNIGWREDAFILTFNVEEHADKLFCISGISLAELKFKLSKRLTEIWADGKQTDLFNNNLQ